MGGGAASGSGRLKCSAAATYRRDLGTPEHLLAALSHDSHALPDVLGNPLPAWPDVPASKLDAFDGSNQPYAQRVELLAVAGTTGEAIDGQMIPRTRRGRQVRVDSDSQRRRLAGLAAFFRYETEQFVTQRARQFFRVLQPCSRSAALDAHLSLCPACRVFGWVRDSGEVLERRADRIDAVAGHVRFTHGVLLGTWDASTAPTRPTPLPVLGTPHPTCTEFYLRAKDDDWERARQTRVPPVLSHKEAFPFPMYRTEEASLRGRKFSRRRETTSAESDDPAAGGLRLPKDEDGRSGVQDSQNQTVYLLPKDMAFSFRVYFDNLTDTEFGALLFALNLEAPESWRQLEPDNLNPLFHALGHGTRLGMGRCSIRVRNLQLDQMDPAESGCRYRMPPDLASTPLAPGRPTCDAATTALSVAWQSLFDLPDTDGEQEFNSIVLELVDMLRICDGPIHYPNRWHVGMEREVEHFDSYTWFMANRRGNPRRKRQPARRTLPLPTDESSGRDQLPIDPAPS